MSPSGTPKIVFNMRVKLKLFFFLLLLPAVMVSSCQSKYSYLPPLMEVQKLEHEESLGSAPISVALVLGGGGARGMAHLGVIEALEEAGIQIDLIVGCSAGSIVGALYADNPDSKKIRAILAPLNKWDLLDYDLLQSQYGIGKGTSIAKLLESNLSAKNFKDLKIPLVVVATDLKTGESVALDKGSIETATRASSAIPGYFEPIEIDGRVLVDGAVVNQVPVDVALRYKAEMIIAVDINEVLAPEMPTNFLGVAKRCMEIKFYHQNQSCLQGADFVIKPDVGQIGTFDDGDKHLIYEAGKMAALKMIPQITEAKAMQIQFHQTCAGITSIADASGIH
ncbi:MAG: NTE family protein [Chlamydiales bacterium]|jgi:NTE family protein